MLEAVKAAHDENTFNNNPTKLKQYLPIFGALTYTLYVLRLEKK